MMEWGLRGAPAAPRAALSWRLLSLAVFLALWSLAGGLVELTRPFNPLFLPAPWVVIGPLVLRHRDLGVRRRGKRPRLSDQRRSQLLPGATDARRRPAARPTRLWRQRARARAGASRAALAASAMKIHVRGLSRTFVAAG